MVDILFVDSTDHNAYMDAATPGIKDDMVGASEATSRDFNQEQVEDLAMRNEFIEDAQAPQTPGLVEVPNSSSIRENLVSDDHMEVEELNAEEGRKASEELDANEAYKPDEDLPSESEVVPMEVEKSLIDENANAQNEPEEERAHHVHVSTSPCCSHMITEVEDPGQAITEAGTDANNAVADKSDAVPSVESPGEPTVNNAEHCLSQEPKDPGEENQDHFAIATEINQKTDSSIQGDGQAYSKPDEQLNEQLVTGCTDFDLPAPEKVLAAPETERQGDENGFMVESTPDKEDPGTCNEDAGNNNKITGKKRTFTESTITAESLNSVESVGLIQSKRTADSVPDDDDLLSSILVGKSSFLKMRSTPVLEIATTKRSRAAPRSTATKRKVLMDDPMVLHGEYVYLSLVAAILNETYLKGEDELPREDKKTDESAEVSEIGIDDQTPCDNTIGSIENGHVEAGDLGLESLNEPLVEENNDVVNPEIEPDNNYEPHNEMFNEEAYMQSAPGAEALFGDGFIRDNYEMDTMEVAHDTGFLNVDDDEVDEDHEEDEGMEEGDETRLLENSGWSSRTRAVAKYLQRIFDKEAENGKSVVVADKLLAGKTRKEASRMFFETLVLKTRDYIQVEQANPYESITIKPRPKLTKSIF
ncbi:hypothetical protein F2Q69_00000682 [Brassica cretica]|uniref:Rad21/Rec8-like protein C-terminal eukaryotic domain-containing protein n=1 Tax=Brassica cretica TaxID=69181 RepID=A0A8S9P0Y9_BRACR|nr:hypothetical protein F2Q69_00000682 [Brassica cretica]